MLELDYNTIITTLLGLVTGGGGLGVFLQRRHNKKMRELEARLAEANVDKAKTESKAEEWHIWKEQCEALSEHNQVLIERNQKLVDMNAEKEDRHQQDIRDWEQRFTDQTTYLRQVQRDLIAANDREKEHIRKEALLEAERAHYFNWRCFREDDGTCEGCSRRKPKQPTPIKYIPLTPEELQPGLSPAPLTIPTNTINLKKENNADTETREQGH